MSTLTYRDRLACLHCGETRATIETKDYACVWVSGYEVQEIDREFDRHRFTPWTNDELRRFGVAPHAYGKHRATGLALLEADLACADTIRGHHEWQTDESWRGSVEEPYCGWCYLPKSVHDRALAPEAEKGASQ